MTAQQEKFLAYIDERSKLGISSIQGVQKDE